MVYAGLLANITASDFKIECSDFIINGSVVAYLNDGLLYVEDILTEVKIISGLDLTASLPGVIEPQYEYYFAITLFDLEQVDTSGNPVMVLNCITNTGVNTLFEINTNSDVKVMDCSETKAFIEKKLTSKFVTLQGTQNINIKVSIDDYLKGYDDTIKMPDLSIFEKEIPPVANYFTNITNYKRVEPGGIGGTRYKEGEEISPTTNYKYKEKLLQLWGDGAPYGFSAELDRKIGNGKFQVGTSGESPSSFTVGSVFETLYHGEKTTNGVLKINAENYNYANGESAFFYLTNFGTTVQEYFK